MMNGEFDRATCGRATRRGSDAATVHDGWDISGNANGGYLLASRGTGHGRASPAARRSRHRALPRAAPAGPCVVEVELGAAGQAVRHGRPARCASDGEREVLRRSARSATSDQADGRPDDGDGAPPELPPIDECVVPRGPTTASRPVRSTALAVRLRPERRWVPARRTQTGRAEMAGWFAFADGRPIDALALLLVADAFPPAVFNLDLPAAGCRRSSSRCTCAASRARARCGACSAAGSSRAGCSKRTARCGTHAACSWRRAASCR